MFACTENALETIRECHPAGTALRLSISPRGCGAPVVTLIPDSPSLADEIFTVEGRTVCIDRALCETTKSIELGSINGRLVVTMEEPIKVYGCGLCPASPTQGGACGIIEGKNF